jgi:phage FluMu protein Com
MSTELKENPLLSRINKMPGQVIRLPSLGYFYKNGELSDDVVNGEIIINPMTMSDEILMKSPDFLFQGISIDRVFKRCSPQIKKPMELLTSDVDYILTQLRMISYGPTIDVSFTCSNPDCKEHQELSVKLEYFTQSSKEIDLDNFDSKYIVNTKSDPRKVVLRPARFEDFIHIQQINLDSLSNPENLEDFILDNYVSFILSVDDIENNSPENRKMIKEWLSAIPRSDTKLINDVIAGVQDWGPKFNYKAKCNKCKHVNDLSTELNPTAFFIQPSSQETVN